MELDNQAAAAAVPVAPKNSAVDPGIVTPIVDAVLSVLIKYTSKLPHINAGLVGLNALVDAWLPDFLATLTPDQMTLTGIATALLVFLQKVTKGNPILQGILSAAVLILPYLLPKVKGEMSTKGIKPAVHD